MINLSIKSMRVVGTLFFVLVLSTVPSSGLQSGGMSPLLSKIAQALECYEKQTGTRWKIERIEPIKWSENVLIKMFVSGSRRVKVSIIEYKSAAEAIEAMKPGAAGKSAKPITNLGDEAYSWGYSDIISFRKGTLTVHVSAHSDIDQLLPMLDQAERWSLRRNEEAALNKGV